MASAGGIASGLTVQNGVESGTASFGQGAGLRSNASPAVGSAQFNQRRRRSVPALIGHREKLPTIVRFA